MSKNKKTPRDRRSIYLCEYQIIIFLTILVSKKNSGLKIHIDIYKAIKKCLVYLILFLLFLSPSLFEKSV